MHQTISQMRMLKLYRPRKLTPAGRLWVGYALVLLAISMWLAS